MKAKRGVGSPLAEVQKSVLSLRGVSIRIAAVWWWFNGECDRCDRKAGSDDEVDDVGS